MTTSEQENPTYEVRGTHGVLTIDRHGYVLSYEPQPKRNTEYTKIHRFDLTEWASFWGEAAPHQSMDILDLGFWYFGSDNRHHYEPPEMDWRKEIAQQLMERTPTC
jgi:hypothetical protein